MGEGLRVCAGNILIRYDMNPEAPERLGVLFFILLPIDDIRDVCEMCEQRERVESPSHRSYEGLVGVALAGQWSAFRDMIRAERCSATSDAQLQRILPSTNQDTHEHGG